MVVAVIATTTTAVMTATRRRNGDAAAMVMDGNGWCNGNARNGKRVGERILLQKHWDFAVADNIRAELCDKYVVEINNHNKEWMVMAPRGGRW